MTASNYKSTMELNKTLFMQNKDYNKRLQDSGVIPLINFFNIF
jgi:hypothetical protein